jgi:hypothetical protein
MMVIKVNQLDVMVIILMNHNSFSLISFQVHLYKVIIVEYGLIILDYVEVIEYFYSERKKKKSF